MTVSVVDASGRTWTFPNVKIVDAKTFDENLPVQRMEITFKPIDFEVGL